MEYTVQRGDTIAKVTGLLGTDWQTLKTMNPGAVGRSKVNGNWFVREGKTVSVQRPFRQVLEEQEQLQKTGGSVLNNLRHTAGRSEIKHTLKPGETVWELAVKRYHVDPDEVLRLNDISDPRKLQPGRQLRIPVPEKTEEKDIVASWYGEYHHGRPMANGEPYDMYGNTIAHKKIPLGTRVEIENPRTGQKVRAIVADRGPYVEGRDVDLSYGLARQLSMVEQGVGNLVMRIL